MSGTAEVVRIKSNAWLDKPADGGLPWPVGEAQSIARFVHNTALRPVREVAVVAALGWLAGVCGKVFNTPSRTGLNCYIILVARSAIGKEAMHQGTSMLTQALKDAGITAAAQFVSFERFRSGPALRKALPAQPSFVNVNSEWGLTMRSMMATKRQPDGPMQTLRAEMTELYHKSGQTSVAGGARYSNAKESVEINGSVAYSMIGETTPGTFLQSLTSDMMEDGFASRFSVIEYQGERPPENAHHLTTVPRHVLETCAAIVTRAAQLLRDGKCVICTYDPDAQRLRDEFNRECDAHINKTQDEGLRQIWNRADLKAQRIACLLAVADNCITPVVGHNHMAWAIELVQRNIKLYTAHIENGDVGDDDGARDAKLLKWCKEFLQGVTEGYHIPDSMVKQGIVSRKYLQQRSSSQPLFKNAPGGATKAFDTSLRSLCDSGYLLEVDKVKAADDFGFQGRCYRITNLPNGLLE